MSAPTKPFAWGPGILIGILFLWAGAFGLFLLGMKVWAMLAGTGAEA